MSSKGFTLVELLAVIVILAIILAIAIPGISGIISNASSSSFESDAKMLLKAVDYKLAQDDEFDVTSINESNVDTLLNINNSNYERLNIKKINGIVYATIVGKGKWNNLTVSGTKESAKVVDTVSTLVRGANAPVLATGMTPIKWNGTTWVSTTADDAAWYNYDTTNKIWANAKTADGSMWVWIPRYIYKISTGWHSNTAGTIDIQFSKGIDDNWNKAVIGNIDLGETSNASNNKWTNHPAFTFGDTELTGIWVAKFEASNDGSNNVKIIPDAISWRSMTNNDIFIKIRSMETNNAYGWGTTGNGIDTHMMKNTEWGVVVYLAKSTYGINSQIYKNNSSGFYTGRSGGNVGGSQITVGGNEYLDTGFYTYDGKCATTTTIAPGINANCTSVGAAVSDTLLSYKASTTGNIYGIYDMSGGSWEYMASYLNNGHTNLTTYGNSVYIANNKYKNVYAVASTDSDINNYALAINHKGDAVYETSNTGSGSTSWYGDYSYMTRIELPWFTRGGNYVNEGYAGSFYFYYRTGGAATYGGFRPTLIVASGL